MAQTLAQKRAARGSSGYIAGTIIGTLLVVATCIALWEWVGWPGPALFMLARFTMTLIQVASGKMERCVTCNQFEARP